MSDDRSESADGTEVTDRVRPARRRRRGRLVLMIVAGLIVALAGSVVATGLYLQHRIGQNITYIEDPFPEVSDRPTVAEPADSDPGGQDAAPSQPQAQPPVNFLVLGSDSRISAGDPSQWTYGAQRTDAIMLVHVAGDRQSVQIMSIPRDSWVPVPGYGMRKINAAYSFGGPALLIQTVEQLTQVRIDHFIIADFESFTTLTDDLGGVEITLPDGLDNRGYTLPPGTHTLNGAQALAYAQQRYGLPAGDFDRIRRQQNWMRSILRAAFDQDVLADPLALTGLLESAAATLSVDTGFTVPVMRDLALSLRELQPESLTFLTVPVAGTGTTPGGQSIVNLDRHGFDALMSAVRDDRLEQYIADNADQLSLLDGEIR